MYKVTGTNAARAAGGLLHASATLVRSKPHRYPLFSNPEEYLRFRRASGPLGISKRYFEQRALDQCLDKMDSRECVLDCPCGPGRLFPYWRKRFSTVIGVDLSESMFQAAVVRHTALHLDGTVLYGDAFDVPAPNDYPQPDLVASVRFIYYFERTRRIELLRSFAQRSRRYLLVQYKTTATPKGRRNVTRAEAKRSGGFVKQFCSDSEIEDEIAAAGLSCLHIQPIGFASDRAFVLAAKP